MRTEKYCPVLMGSEPHMKTFSEDTVKGWTAHLMRGTTLNLSTSALLWL